jgi:hypothetical protein
MAPSVSPSSTTYVSVFSRAATETVPCERVGEATALPTLVVA